tara:strand:- start:840 stop:1526 length:687 start_codon:yes stop_codon:yes gene_type:complete
MHNSINNKIKNFSHDFAIACRDSKRSEEDISIIAVSKKHDPSLIKDAYQNGFNNFGENFAQELEKKATALKDHEITWHFIGPIQSNKIKLVATHAHWVHSLDREKIILKLNNQCKTLNKNINVCIQVNIDNEVSKSGINPNKLLELSSLVEAQSNLNLRGIMVLPKLSNKIEETKKVMGKCFALHANLKLSYPNADILSMGTTSDFKTAIESGSNMIRVGESIFGKRQ